MVIQLLDGYKEVVNMSWYYNYYLGYSTPDGKIYPLGAYDDKGELHSVFWRSRSFASDLWRNFIELKKDSELISDEFKKAFSSEDGTFYGEFLSYLPIDELPKGDFVKSGYFLTEDVNRYIHDKEYYDDLFYDKLTPQEFAFKLDNELKHGYVEEKDEFGYPITRPCRDYMWFAYPDYNCEEYEAFLIREFASAYEYSDSLKDNELVVILSQG